MTKRTFWKIVATLCLVAMLLPTFSGLTFAPATAESDSTPPSPLPYALEFLGQEHPKMYLTESTVTVDGAKNSNEDYALLTEKTDADGNSNGIFSGEANPTTVRDPASEIRPKYLRIYGNYSENGMNFYVEAKSRTHITGVQVSNQNLLKLAFGTDFGPTATDANTITTITYKFTSGNNEVSGTQSGTTFSMKKVNAAETITDSTGTYTLTESCYEVFVPWSVLGFASYSEVDLDRVYFRANYFYYTGSTTDNGATNDYNYWFYGLPYNTYVNHSSPSTLDAMYMADYGENLKTMQMVFPHVLELAGTKPAALYKNLPSIAVQNKLKDDGDSYTATFDYALTSDNTVTEAGVLYANTAEIGGNSLILTDSAAKHTVALTDGKATFTHSFAIANYDTFVSFRPYVKYSDGTVIYGEYLNTSANYLTAVKSGFDKVINVLMIGCSFNYYYLDELVNIAAADNIQINANKAYYSGNPANSTWNWLIHDGAYWQEFQHNYKTPAGTSKSSRTLKQILEGGDEKLTWNFISVQDHYGPGNSKSYEACLEKSLPYLANTFRYLEATEPQATLLLHETWAYDAEHKDWGNSGITANQDTVNEHQANISKTIYHMSESIPANGTIADYKGMPIVPSGAAWNHARNGVEIGGTTYKIEGTLTKDLYHDGETQGGQYLNACVWYEVLTGNSCIGNTWRPSYALDETRALTLQKIAHQAVADLYGANYAVNIPAVRN